MTCLLAGCDGRVTGFAWDVVLTDNLDECNDPPVAYNDTLEYVLNFNQATVELSLGPAVWGTGSIAGCSIVYESVPWVEERDGHTISWKIEGNAIYRQGGSACNLEDGVDWLGSETFTILSSEHPDIETGCRYGLDTRGTYFGELR